MKARGAGREREINISHTSGLWLLARVQGDLQIKLAQWDANYTSEYHPPPSNGCYLNLPHDTGVTLKVPQTNAKLPGSLAVSLKMTSMWKCFRNIKVNHPLSLLASSSRVQRKLNSSSFFPTKWIRTSFNLLHIICRNAAWPNACPSLFLQKKKVKHRLLWSF